MKWKSAAQINRSLERHFGKVFVRNTKHGFEMLVYGCFWMHVMEGNFGGMKSRDGIEYFDDCSILWNDITTITMGKEGRE